MTVALELARPSISNTWNREWKIYMLGVNLTVIMKFLVMVISLLITFPLDLLTRSIPVQNKWLISGFLFSMWFLMIKRKLSQSWWWSGFVEPTWHVGFVGCNLSKCFSSPAVGVLLQFIANSQTNILGLSYIWSWLLCPRNVGQFCIEIKWIW